MVRVHDVVVIGAGPGGSATAHFLSARGLDVVLLDRAEFPRDKTCGDGLTPRALRMLREMDLLPRIAAVGCPIEAYEVVAPNGRSTTARVSGALVVPRLTLDAIILQRAIDSGARFEPKVNMTRVESGEVHAEDGRSFRGRVVIIATGAATAVLRRSGIVKEQPRAMLAARAYYEVSGELRPTFQLSFRNVPHPGYGWVFPTGTRTANVGVGFLPTGRTRPAPREMERFLNGLPGLRQLQPVKAIPSEWTFSGRRPLPSTRY